MTLLALALPLLALLHGTSSVAGCPPNATVHTGTVLGSGSLAKELAHTSDACCALCAADARCVAWTFEKKDHGSACFLKDNLAQCGTKPTATSGVLPGRAPQPAGQC
eukprot:COSAG04_NODE_13154_length_618_cov_0.888247_1_plen_106_part_01